MKHLIKNNQILLSGIPAYFTRENGEGFWGGYDLRTDLHYLDGWRDEIIPEFDDVLQTLGSPYYDPASDKVKYPVVPIQFDIDSLLQNRLNEFEQFQKAFRREITELFLEEIALGTLSSEVKSMIQLLAQRKNEVIEELKGFHTAGNIERLINYSFYTAETEQFKEALRLLKQ